MEIVKGRPLNVKERLKKEVRVYDLLDELDIEYWRIDHEVAQTMEDCEEVDRILDAVICKFLDITPGSVSVMGLMNDTENQVQLLVDADVLEGEYLGCHPCINTSSLKLRTRDVFTTYLNAVHHDYIVVHLENRNE